MGNTGKIAEEVREMNMAIAGRVAHVYLGQVRWRGWAVCWWLAWASAPGQPPSPAAAEQSSWWPGEGLSLVPGKLGKQQEPSSKTEAASQPSPPKAMLYQSKPSYIGSSNLQITYRMIQRMENNINWFLVELSCPERLLCALRHTEPKQNILPLSRLQ